MSQKNQESFVSRVRILLPQEVLNVHTNGEYFDKR